MIRGLHTAGRSPVRGSFRWSMEPVFGAAGRDSSAARHAGEPGPCSLTVTKTRRHSIGRPMAKRRTWVALGMPGAGWPPALSGSIGALQPDALVMLGQRDDEWRRALGVGSVAGHVMLRSAEQVATGPASAARDAVRQISAQASNWWLHIDLDVLADQDFFARGAPGEIVLSGGLTWEQLTEVVQAAVRAGGCRGLSVVIYNPDLDPDRRLARRIVQFVAEIARDLP